jgi:hypothetical protein
MGFFSNLVSAPFRAVAAAVAIVDSDDTFGIAEAADAAAEVVKDATEYVTGESQDK